MRFAHLHPPRLFVAQSYNRIGRAIALITDAIEKQRLCYRWHDLCVSLGSNLLGGVMHSSSKLKRDGLLKHSFTGPIIDGVHSLWSSAKRTRTLRVGPLNLIYRFSKSTKATRLNRYSQASLSKAEIRSEANCQPASCAQNFEAGTALLVGVGPGLGVALAKTLSDSGMTVVAMCRNVGSLSDVIESYVTRNEKLILSSCDVTDSAQFNHAFESVIANVGVPQLVIYLVQGFSPGSFLNTSVEKFEDAWRANCLGAFVVGQTVARKMITSGGGSIILAGATSGTIGRAGYTNLAVGKFGLRALSQVMARELWPKGIHVAHVVLDADIQDDFAELGEAIKPAAMNALDAARVFYDLHRQSPSAWSQEIDLRPWNERFWEHC